jgi:hypothetical protein
VHHTIKAGASLPGSADAWNVNILATTIKHQIRPWRSIKRHASHRHRPAAAPLKGCLLIDTLAVLPLASTIV